MFKHYHENIPVIPLKDLFPASIQRNARKTELKAFYNAMQTILKPLSESVLFGVSISVCNKTLIYHLAIILYYFDIQKEKLCLK